MADQAAPGFDGSLLDPTTWKDPVEEIPVIVRESRFRWSDAKYNQATTFRPAFPLTNHGEDGHSIQQWVFNLERLDARYVLLDGSEAPVTIYAGVDVEKYAKQRDGSYLLQSIMKGKGKEQEVVQAWVKAAGSLTPDPSVLVGQMWMINFYRQKDMGGGFFAKKVTLPKELLPPTYVYSGEVQKFVKKPDTADETGSNDGTIVGASSDGSSAVDPALAAAKLGQFIRDNGITMLDSTLLGNPAYPSDCKVEPFISSTVRGTLAATLAEYGVEVA